MAAILWALGAAVAASAAANGRWINVNGGNWGDPANWLDGTVADGEGSLADFSAADLMYFVPTVNLDTPRTVGSLLFGDPDPFSYGGWILSGSLLTLGHGAATPTITVSELNMPDVSLSDPTNDVIIASAIAGSQGFIKQGAGTLTLMANNTMGPVQIDAGWIAPGLGSALGGGNQEVRYNGGGLRLWNGLANVGNTNRVLTMAQILNTNGNYDGLNGPWIGSGTILVRSSGRLTVGGGSAGAFSKFAGLIDLADSPSGCNLRINLGSTTNYDLSHLRVDLGTRNGRVSFRTTSANTTVRIGALLGEGTATRFHSSEQSAGIPLTWEIGALNLSTTFRGTIGEYASGRVGQLVKVGTGTLALSGNSTYTGFTVVANGVLALIEGGALANTPSISVRSGAVLDVSGVAGVWGPRSAQALGGGGTVTGNVAVAAGTVSPGDGVGTLSFANHLTYGGASAATNHFEIGSPTRYDSILVAGDLILEADSAVVVRLAPLGAVIPNGVYILFKWGGSLPASDVSRLTLEYPAQPGTLALEQDLASKEIRLRVTGVAGAADLVWRGDGTANVWDFSAANWREGGSPAVFKGGDNVTFDDSGLHQPAVDIAAAVNPGEVVVNAAKNYVFGSSSGGRITGSGGLVKTNTGQLTLTIDNDYSGDTVIGGGTIQLGDGAAVAGSLGLGNVINLGTLAFYRIDSVTNRSMITGTGAVVHRGGGQLTLSGNNSYSGGTTIRDQGTLLAGSATALGSGPVTLAGGILSSAGLQIDNAVQVTADSTINNTSSSSLQLNSSAISRTGGTLTLSGNGPVRLNAAGLTYSGPIDLQTTLQSYNTEGAQVLNGAISGPGVFQRRWPGQNYTGETVLNAQNTYYGGTLLREGSIGLGASTVSTFPGMIDSGPIGVGALNQDNATYTAVYAAGGARTVANEIVLNSAGQAFIIKGAHDLTLSGPVNLGGASKAIQVENTARTVLSGDISNGEFVKTGSGVLFINGNNNASSSTVSAGALGGMGTFAGPVTVEPGGALSPGAPFGALILQSDLTIGGNLEVEIDKGRTPTSDRVSVGGILTNAGAGTVTVSNLGPALEVSDKFTLFDKPVLNGGALAVSGAGVVWANHLAVDGSISVASMTVPKPAVTTVVLSGDQLVFGGTNGTPGGSFSVWGSTNVTAPPAAWVLESSGSFDGAGRFSVTNVVDPALSAKFLRLTVP